MNSEGKAGHRQRLRKRFLKADGGSISGDLLLELLLSYSIGRKDVGSLSKELIRVFGGLEQVLSASGAELARVEGIGESSIALLKAVNYVKTGSLPSDTPASAEKGAKDPQLKLFEEPVGETVPRPPVPGSIADKAEKPDKSLFPDRRPVDEGKASTMEVGTESEKESPAPKDSSISKPVQRKLQVSNSYPLEFEQLSRILNCLLERRESKRINRQELKEDTGLADRQVESLVSIGTAMGLIRPRVQTLTPEGLAVAARDIFLERQGVLEWRHYKGAGSYRNLVWFEAFNRLLKEESAMTREEWQEYFRNKLKGEYSDKTVKSHVAKEVRFIVDAYTERGFKKLEILGETPDSRIYMRRYTNFSPLVLAAMDCQIGHSITEINQILDRESALVRQSYRSYRSPFKRNQSSWRSHSGAARLRRS